jgi:hypothetical protein
MTYCKASQLDCNGFCNRFDAPCIKKNCRFFGVKTNADRIRAMSDEELAHFMAERNVNESTLQLINKDNGLTAVQIEALRHRIYCAYMQWLKQPAEGE